MNFLLLTETAATTAAATTEAAANQTAQQGGLLGGMGIWGTIIWVVVFGVAIYFLMIRPQKNEQKKAAAMQASMAPGDIVVTTSGFYGEIIDVQEEEVIVEFGNDKHCRIPMKKSAIAQLEKKDAE